MTAFSLVTSQVPFLGCTEHLFYITLELIKFFVKPQLCLRILLDNGQWICYSCYRKEVGVSF